MSEDMTEMPFSEVCEKIPAPDIKMLSIDVMWVAAVAHALKAALKEHFDIDVGDDVCQRFRESLDFKLKENN